MSNETWKKISGQEGRYEVSSLGRIRSFCRDTEGRGLSLYKRKDGYMQVGLCEIGKKYPKHYLVHRLVADAFVPNPMTMVEINHLDGDKTNNNFQNLEWSTRRQNIKHAYDSGLKKQFQGSKHPSAKLTEKDVTSIRRQYAIGNVTQTSLANFFGVTQGLVGHIIRRKIWNHI